jgi:hypothetical protein
MSTSKNKDLSKLSNANDAIEASTLFVQHQEVVESQQIQPTGEQLSIVIDECVGQVWWNYVCQYSAGVYLQCSYTCKFFFIIKVYFPNLDWVGHENFFVRLDGL